MSECRGPVDQDDDVPCVHVRCLGARDTEPEWVAYLEHGLEEEGVPWLVEFDAADDSVAAAHGAALESALKIGVSVHETRIVVHHKQLPDDEPVFDVSEVTASDARDLGSNAARLAKGTPLKSLD
jgi:hypothetical protein